MAHNPLTHRLGDILQKGTQLIDCIRLRSILPMAIACSVFPPGNYTDLIVGVAVGCGLLGML